MAKITVILLIGAVKLGKLGVVIRKGASDNILQPFLNGTAKELAPGLDAFVRRKSVSHSFSPLPHLAAQYTSR
jgi:hypothetical protein